MTTRSSIKVNALPDHLLDFQVNLGMGHLPVENEKRRLQERVPPGGPERGPKEGEFVRATPAIAT
jgi:hypothetical protein